MSFFERCLTKVKFFLIEGSVNTVQTILYSFRFENGLAFQKLGLLVNIKVHLTIAQISP